MQTGFENKKKAMWATVLGALAIAVVAYQFIPMLVGPPTTPGSSAQAAAPTMPRVSARPGGKSGKKAQTESLDPTLRLDLLAASEKTTYEGSGRNIFVSQAEVVIPKPVAPGSLDAANAQENIQWHPPTPPPPAPIPLRFYGFASAPGEPKKIFLKLGDDVFVAGEGEIVDRRYKVIRISPNSVLIEDVVNSGPPQNIPLTQG